MGSCTWLAAPDMQGDAVLEAQQPLLRPAQVCVALVPRQAAVDGRQLAVDSAHCSVEHCKALPLQCFFLSLQPGSGHNSACLKVAYLIWCIPPLVPAHSEYICHPNYGPELLYLRAVRHHQNSSREISFKGFLVSKYSRSLSLCSGGPSTYRSPTWHKVLERQWRSLSLERFRVITVLLSAAGRPAAWQLPPGLRHTPDPYPRHLHRCRSAAPAQRMT